MDIETIPGVLACDVGNTAIHLAYVKGDEVTPMRTSAGGRAVGAGGDAGGAVAADPPAAQARGVQREPRRR